MFLCFAILETSVTSIFQHACFVVYYIFLVIFKICLILCLYVQQQVIKYFFNM